MSPPVDSAPYVRPDVAAFLAYLNSAPGPKLHELEPAAARQLINAMRPVADAEPEPLETVRDLTVPGPAGGLPARLYDARERREPGPLLLFFHGGGFVVGGLYSHEPFCTRAAALLDLPVLAIDYRLAPEHPWPAAPDDCEGAARWAASGPAVLERGVTSLVLAGDSAGATLAIVTAMALRDRPAAAPVIAQMPMYPAVDLREREWGSVTQFGAGHMLTIESMNWFTEQYRPDPLDVRGSPLLGDQRLMPPTLLVTASLDPLRDQGRAFGAALIDAGVPVIFREAVGNIHGFINFAKGIPSSVGDIAGALIALRPMIAEAEANRVVAEASRTI
ncbi:acetyl esterase [Sphingomonas zeicaulis]|uniref:alpha/beta hydrolase n=1 Tax=Sphingomonas zeicaulis TaxID=1632740 RepID=UPI003D1D4745